MQIITKLNNYLQDAKVNVPFEKPKLKPQKAYLER